MPRTFIRVLSALLMTASVIPGVPVQALSQPAASRTVNSASTGSSGLPTDRIIIKYKETASLSAMDLAPGSARMQALNSAAGVSVAYDRAMSGGAYVLKLAGRMPITDVQTVAERISALPGVAYAEPDRILQAAFIPNDPRWSDQWQYYDTYGMNLPVAWEITTGLSSTVVAVIDTGYRPHADLTGRFVQGYDFIWDPEVANDGDGRDADARDPGDWITSADAASVTFAGCPVENSSWHGTHVAGTIAANTNNGVGVAGVNWQAKILPVRVLGKCGGYTSDIVDGMRWAAGLTVSGVPANANPAKVLNISLGGSGTCSMAEQSAVNDINATGAVIVVAAGNSDADAAAFTPSSCDGVIVVGATDKSGTRAYYSNYGSIVDISAPGGAQGYPNDPNGILSTLNAGTMTPGADNYVYYQGTSMAAPHVTGLVSLMLAISPTLSYTSAETILKLSARSFGSGNDCAIMGCGAGIINAPMALAMLRQSPRAFIPFVSAPAGVTVAITNGDFESGKTSWTEFSTHGYTIISTHYPTYTVPHSGSWLAWLGGESSATTYIQQQVKVPTESPYLAYWQWIDSQETGCSYDYGKVFINNTVVNSYGLCKSSNTGGWVKHIVNLSSYAGQTVTLQIRATTDSTINSNLFVDDVVFQPSNTAAADSPADISTEIPQTAGESKGD